MKTSSTFEHDIEMIYHEPFVRSETKYWSDGYTKNENVLMIASSRGNLDLVKYLVENGTIIHHATVLAAVEKNHFDIILYFKQTRQLFLLLKGNVGTHYELYMLSFVVKFAMEFNDTRILALLLSEGLRVHQYDNHRINTLYLIFKEYEKIDPQPSQNILEEILELLINHGGSLNYILSSDDSERSPLSIAISRIPKIISFLLEQGAEMNEYHFVLAAKKNMFDLVKLYVEKYPFDVTGTNFGRKAIMETSSREITDYLLSKGVTFDKNDFW